MSPQEASKALDLALRLRLILFGNAELHRRALAWAGKVRLPATYDAHYLALADLFCAELWTDDRQLAQAASTAVSWVHELAEVS
jgi:predicted nucleic acid-binding protein